MALLTCIGGQIKLIWPDHVICKSFSDFLLSAHGGHQDHRAWHVNSDLSNSWSNRQSGHIHFTGFLRQEWRMQWHPTPVLLPGKSSGWKSLVGCSPWGHTESDTTEATSLSLFTFMHWRRKWQPNSSVLAWRIPGMEEPGGLPSVGSHRVGHDWSDLANDTETLKTKQNKKIPGVY